MEDWARGLVVCTTGLPKPVNNAVASCVEQHGGTWTPRLSRRVTHVLVDSRAACQTQKLTEIQKDRAAWPQEVVDFAWLSDCQQANALLPCDTHRVLEPAMPSRRVPAPTNIALATPHDRAPTTSPAQGPTTVTTTAALATGTTPVSATDTRPRAAWVIHQSQSDTLLDPPCPRAPVAGTWRLPLESLPEHVPTNSQPLSNVAHSREGSPELQDGADGTNALGLGALQQQRPQQSMSAVRQPAWQAVQQETFDPTSIRPSAVVRVQSAWQAAVDSQLSPAARLPARTAPAAWQAAQAEEGTEWGHVSSGGGVGSAAPQAAWVARGVDDASQGTHTIAAQRAGQQPAWAARSVHDDASVPPSTVSAVQGPAKQPVWVAGDGDASMAPAATAQGAGNPPAWTARSVHDDPVAAEPVIGAQAAAKVPAWLANSGPNPAAHGQESSAAQAAARQTAWLAGADSSGACTDTAMAAHAAVAPQAAWIARNGPDTGLEGGLCVGDKHGAEDRPTHSAWQVGTGARAADRSVTHHTVTVGDHVHSTSHRQTDKTGCGSRHVAASPLRATPAAEPGAMGRVSRTVAPHVCDGMVLDEPSLPSPLPTSLLEQLRLHSIAHKDHTPVQTPTAALPQAAAWQAAQMGAAAVDGRQLAVAEAPAAESHRSQPVRPLQISGDHKDAAAGGTGLQSALSPARVPLTTAVGSGVVSAPTRRVGTSSDIRGSGVLAVSEAVTGSGTVLGPAWRFGGSGLTEAGVGNTAGVRGLLADALATPLPQCNSQPEQQQQGSDAHTATPILPSHRPFVTATTAHGLLDQANTHCLHGLAAAAPGLDQGVWRGSNEVYSPVDRQGVCDMGVEVGGAAGLLPADDLIRQLQQQRQLAASRSPLPLPLPFRSNPAEHMAQLHSHSSQAMPPQPAQQQLQTQPPQPAAGQRGVLSDATNTLNTQAKNNGQAVGMYGDTSACGKDAGIAAVRPAARLAGAAASIGTPAAVSWVGDSIRGPGRVQGQGDRAAGAGHAVGVMPQRIDDTTLGGGLPPAAGLLTGGMTWSHCVSDDPPLPSPLHPSLLQQYAALRSHTHTHIHHSPRAAPSAQQNTTLTGRAAATAAAASPQLVPRLHSGSQAAAAPGCAALPDANTEPHDAHWLVRRLLDSPSQRSNGGHTFSGGGHTYSSVSVTNEGCDDTKQRDQVPETQLGDTVCVGMELDTPVIARTQQGGTHTSAEGYEGAVAQPHTDAQGYEEGLQQAHAANPPSTAKFHRPTKTTDSAGTHPPQSGMTVLAPQRVLPGPQAARAPAAASAAVGDGTAAAATTPHDPLTTTNTSTGAGGDTHRGNAACLEQHGPCTKAHTAASEPSTVQAVHVCGVVSEGHVGGLCDRGVVCDGGGVELTDRKVRLQQLQRVKEIETRRGVQSDDPVGAPMSLLPHIDWCVTEAPEDARLVNDDTHNSGDDHMSVGSISGSESVCDGDREYGGEGDDGNVCVGIHMDTDWMDEPLWKGGDLILLLPRDASGHLGVHTLQLTRPTQHILNSTPSGGVCGSVRGITARDVLTAIHNYYAEHMSLGEQLELMYTRANIRRLLQAAFMSGEPVPRSVLLGPRCGWGGLTRCTRDRTLPVYLLQLEQ